MITLPWPPTSNHAFQPVVLGRGRSARARIIKTQAYRDYEAAVLRLLGPRGIATHPNQPLSVEMHLFRPRRQGDIDGPLKMLLDSLNGRAWGDDSQIVELRVVRDHDKENPRVEVHVTPASVVFGPPPSPPTAKSPRSKPQPQLNFFDHRGAH